MKNKAGLLTIIVFSFASTVALATPPSLVEQLDQMNGATYHSSNPSICDLHVETDTRVDPPKLIYTWTSSPELLLCWAEGITRMVSCTPDFNCAGSRIHLLPDGNFLMDDLKFSKR